MPLISGFSAFPVSFPKQDQNTRNSNCICFRRCEIFSVILREEHGLKDIKTARGENNKKIKLRSAFSSTDFVRAINEGRICWTGHVGRMGETKDNTNVRPENMNGRNVFGETGVGRIALKWFFGCLRSLFRGCVCH